MVTIYKYLKSLNAKEGRRERHFEDTEEKQQDKISKK